MRLGHDTVRSAGRRNATTLSVPATDSERGAAARIITVIASRVKAARSAAPWALKVGLNVKDAPAAAAGAAAGAAGAAAEAYRGSGRGDPTRTDRNGRWRCRGGDRLR